MFDDILSGECAQSDWVCYMSVDSGIDVEGADAVDPSLHDEIGLALQRWTNARHTFYFNLFADDPERDIRFKEVDLPGAALADTVVLNYHHETCPVGLYDSGDCEDTTENPPPASHQPERWWHAIIRVDPGLYSFYLREGALAHEIGHIIGLAHYPTPQSSRDNICDTSPPYSPNAASIEDYDCVDIGAVLPKAVDECATNHASNPLMYGDGGPTSDPGQDPRAWVGC